MTDQRCVGVIGCGNMGLALAHRLNLSGFTVLMGSRDPTIRRQLPFEVTSIPDCIRRSAVLFVAIHPEHYTNTLVSPLEHEPKLFDGKILIDISNGLSRKLKEDDLSNAERLQAAIPNAHVVKAFNTVSSFVMESTTAGESRSVFVASDHPSAKEKVMTLARELNFEPLNSGSLRSARDLESYTRFLFPLWKLPLLIALCVLTLWATYTLLTKFFGTKTSWHQLFLHMTNKVLCISAITLLALVYMPSNLACIFQLAYGTRERRFPGWLDRWMLCRKQLGLITFAIGLLHALITLVVMSPAYYNSWFHPSTVNTIPTTANQTTFVVKNGMMTWKGELASLMGILTLLSMSILALASIPAIGNLLNWREWRFIQSQLGTVTLLFAIGHVFAMAAPRWVEKKSWTSLYSVGFLCVVFPVITILLKFVFCLPCLSRPIDRIRRGEKPTPTV